MNVIITTFPLATEMNKSIYYHYNSLLFVRVCVCMCVCVYVCVCVRVCVCVCISV